ncbi:MAG TPA: hypothetical protein VH062_13820 [Polyangiaceae bacterium]|nr:hypothetical protein [Polyangiaceae bacterium]
MGVPVACGGRVIGEPTPDLAVLDAATPATPASAGGSNDSFDGTLALSDCIKGFVQMSSPDRTCVYRVDGRCYDTKVKACACACPSKVGTQCINGFPESDGSTIVTCS